MRVGMEATGYSRWFERLLAELGIEVWIGDAAKIKTKRVRKQKTDRQDAQLLLKLLLENNFPRVWVNSLAGAGNRPASVKSFQAIPHPREILRDRQIAAGQFFQSPYAVLSVVDRSEQPGAKQIGQLASIDPVILVPGLQQGILPWITDQHFRDMRLE